MEKKRNQKGFTLAELLIVVAIIAVLVAIAIPIFTTQLEKSREATDLANVRSAYGQLVSQYLTDNNAATATVEAKQKKAKWQSQNNADTAYIGTDITSSGSGGANSASAAKIAVPSSPGSYTLSINDDGDITVTAGN